MEKRDTGKEFRFEIKEQFMKGIEKTTKLTGKEDSFTLLAMYTEEISNTVSLKAMGLINA